MQDHTSISLSLPQLTRLDDGPDTTRFLVGGEWVIAHQRVLEAYLSQNPLGEVASSVVFVFATDARCDTFGALMLRRIFQPFRDQSALRLEGSTSVLALAEAILLSPPLPKSVRQKWLLTDIPEETGASLRETARDLLQAFDLLGGTLRGMAAMVRRPRLFRTAAFVHQMERVGVHGLPIVLLISFIVGIIVAQQGLLQLEKFGAGAFVVNLLGVLVFRELGVLLAAIMMAGRSGSAYTAEIGSMKMREEVDALRVMGLDPVHVLVVPRVLALVVSLPLLSIAASLAALFGGALVSLFYGGLSLDLFMERLRESIGLNTVLVGLIKAPFLALVIGLIACLEGLNVKGSAESLGRQTTSSVVKAIFMVIVLDGFFAIFFGAIKY